MTTRYKATPTPTPTPSYPYPYPYPYPIPTPTPTPTQYCLSYARSHGGCVMSNDLYRDQLQAAQKRGDTRQAISAMQARLASNLSRPAQTTYIP